jgi:hypothetical protein
MLGDTPKDIQNISGATGKPIFSEKCLSDVKCISVSGNGNKNNFITLSPIATTLMTITFPVLLHIIRSLLAFWKIDKKDKKNVDIKSPCGVMSFPTISNLKKELKKREAKEAADHRIMSANINPDSERNVSNRRNMKVGIGDVKAIKVKLNVVEVAQLQEINERLELEVKTLSDKMKRLVKNHELVVDLASNARNYLKRSFHTAFPTMTLEAMDILISRCRKAGGSDVSADDESEVGESVGE